MIHRRLLLRPVLKQITVGSIRFNSTSVPQSYFELFPKSFPNAGPPKDSFQINEKQLRKEYRTLQSINHPDKTSEAVSSTNINKAFTNLRNPYLRLAHIIKLKTGKDIQDDSISKKYISDFQNSSPENSLIYKNMLLQVMEAHEQLELSESEKELENLEIENDERIEESCNKIEKELKKSPINWDELIIDAIKLKYWVNIQNGIKDWEPGKPVHLTH
ncbi:uncharacterized protein KGF55_004496 [Candida pseudojiufengensis]|uniref:uncharacterized protein n=1 Tax=Candida pseudojiufengensis TaxID=497109 RepID=UPI00222552D5|nr:uncharacterized protein KGF55_004496 [Candida pseudojiufengensis]KAI5960603.1 hypothetical protein KGF55_004496 [Candida pseudojiufengensis]